MTFQAKTNTLSLSFMTVNLSLKGEAEISTDQVIFELN